MSNNDCAKPNGSLWRMHFCPYSGLFQWLTVGLVLAACAIPAGAQPFLCSSFTGVPPTVRAEGNAEVLGDIALNCVGGVPTPANLPVPQANIIVSFDTNVSSKVTAVSNGTEFLESLLIIDEPSSPVNPAVPILNCGNSGAPDNTAAGPGVCTILGGGASGAAATYNGTPGHPNVFQGRSFELTTGQSNQVVFLAVPIDPPGTICPGQASQPFCHRIIRITNIRGDAAAHAQSSSTVTAMVVSNPAFVLPIDVPQTFVARVLNGLATTVSLSSVHLEERFNEAWKPKNIAFSITNGVVCPNYSYLGGTAYPPDAAQNVVGVVYNTESGFQWQNDSTNGPPSPNPPFCSGSGVPNLGHPLASLGLGGLNTGIAGAGVADSGTRLALQFRNIPPGASVQIPPVVNLVNIIGHATTGVMVLTNTDATGAGPFSARLGTLTSSSNLAVYEVLFSNPNALEAADVPFTLLDAPPNTALSITTSFAPFYPAAGRASATLPVPRFATAQAGEGTVYAATNNGVFKSIDGGATWAPANSGLEGIDVFSLAIDPADPATLYAGTLGSRVFKSTNGGQSWIAASSGLADTIVLSLAIDPTNPSTIYAGTATSAFFPGSGVFKSTNGGQSWSASNSGLPSAIIDVLRIDPSQPATIYAGTNFAGVFKSTNGGQSWTADNSGMNPAGIEDLAVDPSNSATVYAGIGGCSFNCAGPAGVFKTINGGINWTGVNSGLTDLQVLSLAVDPSSTNTLYAGTRLNGVFKSTNGGANWSLINPVLLPTLLAINHLPLVADLLHSGTVYAGTINGVFKSTNGGMTWGATNNGFPASTNILALAVESAAKPTIATVTAQVESLELNSGEKNSLIAKLRAAQDSLARGNGMAAKNQLRALMNEVQALERSGRLDQATASSLESAIQTIIDTI